MELTHCNLTSAVAGHVKRFPSLGTKSDIYIGYLPLAHVFELITELCALTMGVRVSSFDRIDVP